ncbi:hypothetical protein [Methanogenium organophilum]|uniref:Dret-0059-like sensor domain-containing protein n=1 Tax=Methanogenium organophilum TaxID=2199 RepID=A0A9X9T777_METOG|nr:hypothetical protein [Methanogenium organophilum]WAI00430.1 hypothetical protein OU421_08295 [Methanogenium organophilum]
MGSITPDIRRYVPALIAIAFVCAVILSAGCVATDTSADLVPDETVAHTEMLRILGTLQGDINTQLLALDKTTAETAAALSETGLDSGHAYYHEPLTTLLYADPAGKTVITVDRDGTVLSGVPATQTDILIGKNLGNQSVVETLFATKQALMSDLFPLEQGGHASVIEYPVFTEEECLTGLVSLSFAPDEIIGRYAVPAVEGTPYSIMAAQTDGRILYDADTAEIGKETFNESLYEDFPEIQDFAHHYAGNWSGYDTYTFYETGFGGIVQKEAYWTTIGIHGTQWRLIIIHEIGAAGR